MLLLIDRSTETNRGAPPFSTHTILPGINTFADIAPSCDSCGRVSETMAAIPCTLQMVKARKRNQKAKGNKGGKQDQQFYDSVMGAENPTRYNSKMMNSIWGQYNELSVHNFKSLQCGEFNIPEFPDPRPGLQQTQQMMLQQKLQTGNEQKGPFRQILGELGQTVTNNFLDNLNLSRYYQHNNQQQQQQQQQQQRQQPGEKQI